MQARKNWSWLIIGCGALANGTLDAVDPRDAITRALTSNAADGQMVGEMFGVSPDVLPAIPANFDAFYEGMHGDVYVAVREVDPARPKRRTMPELRALWTLLLSNVPVQEDGDTFDGPFLDFAKGSSRDEVWHWFEEQHPDFRVHDALMGIWPQ